MINRFSRWVWRFISQSAFKIRFKNIGKGTIIYKPIQLDSVSSVSVEKDVFICEGAWIMGNSEETLTITIGSNTAIGHFSHIIGKHSVRIGQNVLIADRVFISDCTHIYEDIGIPIISQGVEHLSPVVIGNESWIGENVCICGASIGKHCVIGANSVVLSDIPDYCVAVGNPAKVVKKYDSNKNEWIKQ